MKAITLSIALVFSTVALFGQSAYDAIRFSQTQYGGTARSIAMGSAFGALGGDFASASINPAGLGMYRSSEFMLSPTLNVNGIETNFQNKNLSDNRYSFNFNNISYVGSIKTNAESGIMNVTFGIGYNRIKDFNANYIMTNNNATSTPLNYYTENIDNGMKESHYEELFWDSWLIDYSDYYEANYNDFNMTNAEDELGKYVEFNQYSSWEHLQKKVVQTRGKIDEYLLSMAMNINHRIFVGASVGLLDLNYSSSSTFRESDNYNYSDYLSSYEFVTNNDIEGFGVNFKIGAVVRPIKSLRIGAAIHTPSFYTMSFNEDKLVYSYFDNEVGETGSEKTSHSTSSNQYFDYNFETPFKAVFSAAYQIGSIAIVSLDYDYINYNGMRFRDSGDNYDYSDKNDELETYFKSSSDWRIGAEIMVTPNFSVRAGYNLFGNPWKDSFQDNNDNTYNLRNANDITSSYSAGVGYRQNNFFIDFAYRLTNSETTHLVYDSYEDNGQNLAKLNGHNNQSTLSIGWKF